MAMAIADDCRHGVLPRERNSLLANPPLPWCSGVAIAMAAAISMEDLRVRHACPAPSIVRQ
jgi:hypothetical protein